MGVQSHLAWDFAEFNRHINALARGLLRMGVNKGNRVGDMCFCNAAMGLRITMNPAYRINELTAALHLAGVAHFFLVPQIRTSSYIRLLSEKFPALRNSTPGAIQEPALPEFDRFGYVANKKPISGTTGGPKAVSLTHFNFLNNAISIARCMSLSETDVLCNVVNLHILILFSSSN
ncbi:hypothetical protein B0H12DRAFT_1216992 [Mycena haematopus]|nr:hypothetical protein B0H12DRAFT_1216992 [Mycena haematopus]